MEQASEPAARDIILIGGSTGAIEALLQLLKAVPSDISAAIFVVVHTTAEGPGLLPRVLSRAARIPAVHPKNQDRIRPGHIYVAPPDHHLMLGADDTIYVRRGPRENGARPAIDPLFRTAAAEGYGPRTIAAVLSGYLDDGAAGLYAIRKRGGLSIIQDPNDALADAMPANALRYAGADFVLPAREIGLKLVELVQHAGRVIAMRKRNVESERARAQQSSGIESEIESNRGVAYPEEGNGTPSVFACPECHGVLWEIKEGGSVRYRCRVGHGYSEATLNEELSQAAESALWAAMRALEEKAAMARRMANSTTGPPQWQKRMQEQAEGIAAHAEMIRRMVFGEPPEAEAPAPPESLERHQAD